MTNRPTHEMARLAERTTKHMRTRINSKAPEAATSETKNANGTEQFAPTSYYESTELTYSTTTRALSAGGGF